VRLENKNISAQDSRCAEETQTPAQKIPRAPGKKKHQRAISPESAGKSLKKG